MKKTAIVLFNLGGPDNLAAVKPFLFNLFYDKAIINLPNPFRYFLAKLISSRRNLKACEIYLKLGGKSPILDITNAQAEALEKELSFNGNFKVFVCMRYWHPMSSQVVKDIAKYGANEVIMLPLYPQFSSTTTQSSFNNFEQEIQKNNLNVTIKKICCYPTNDLFIASHIGLINQVLAQLKNDGHKVFRLLFSAHGLPQKVIDNGDPYVFQVNLTAKAIIAKLQNDPVFKGQKIDYQVCYQSKVGPLKWTTPSLEDEVKRAAQDKVGIVILPIAFTSDHSETLVELDMEYKEIAHNYQIPFYYRVKALNSDDNFIKSLSAICQKVTKTKEFFASDSGKKICNNKLGLCPCQL